MHLVILWGGYRLEYDVEAFTLGDGGFLVRLGIHYWNSIPLLSTGRSDTLIPLSLTGSKIPALIKCLNSSVG